MHGVLLPLVSLNLEFAMRTVSTLMYVSHLSDVPLLSLSLIILNGDVSISV